MKHLSKVSIVLGAVLLISAIAIMAFSGIRADRANRDAQQILEKLQPMLPEAEDRVPEQRGNNAMASMEIQGVNIAGILELPKYGRTLPLAASWDTDLVSSMPCRFAGSIYDSSLIIGGVDSQEQFSFASRMEVGDRLYLTDMEGGRYTYCVAAIQHAQHATLDKLQAGEYPLTVFVKDSKTSEYLLIRLESDFGG